MSRPDAPETNTQLAGRPLALARALGLLVVALAVGLALFDIPFQLVHDQTLCASSACPGDQLTSADLVQLQQAGLTLGFLAGYQVAVNTITVLAFTAVGGVIFWSKSRDWFGIFTAVTLAAAGFTLTLGGPPLPAMVDYYPAVLWPIQFLNLVGNAALFLFFYLFPDGHFVPRWTAGLVPVMVVHQLVKVVRPDLLGDNDWTIYPIVLGALLTLIYRYRRVSNALQRQQTKWVVFGSAVAIAGLVSMLIYSSVVPQNDAQPIVGLFIYNTVWFLFILLIPLSIGMAILRSRLWDIDILIRRTLVYGALTALLALVYFGAVVALQAIFTALTGQQRSELVTVISTLVIAALFVPLRGQLQALIDRRFYRRKYDAGRTLAQFSGTLRDEVNLDDLSAHLLAAVDDTMQPETVQLWLVKQ